MRLRLLAYGLLLTGSLFAADPELLSLAPPDTQAMAGVNIQQVALSPLGQYLLAESKQQAASALQKLAESTGFDVRRDLREVLFAMNAQGGSNPGVVLARGTFDVARIVEAALASGAKIETYKGVQLVLPGGNELASVAFPDSTLAIAGTAANVHAALDRKSAPTSVSSALAVAVNAASLSEDAWFVTIAPPSQLAPHETPAGAPDPLAMLSKVVQASGGVRFGANVVVTLKAVSATPQDATALTDGLKMLAGMVAMGGQNDPSTTAFAGLLRNLSISADGNATNISLTVPEAQVEELLKTKSGTTGTVGYDVTAPARHPAK